MAVEILRRRDPREFAGVLVGMIRDRIKYKVNPVGGPGSPGALTVQGEDFDTQRVYSPPPTPTYIPALNDTVFPDAFGLPVVYHPLGNYAIAMGQDIVGNYQAQVRNVEGLQAAFGHAGLGQVGAKLAESARNGAAVAQAQVDTLKQHAGPAPGAPLGFEQIHLGVNYLQIPIGQMMAASQATAFLAQKQLEADARSIDELNAQISESNSRTLQVLTQVSGQDFGSDRKSWDKWLTDLKGYAYVSSTPAEKPTVVQDVPLSVVPQPTIALAAIEGPIVNVPRHSCFGAGTLVHTVTGPARSKI